jgi:hypothetical protein
MGLSVSRCAPACASSYARLLAFADRLHDLPAGSAAADVAIHEALGRSGAAPPYTRDDAAARSLLPAGFEEIPGAFSTAGRVSAGLRRCGLHEGLPHSAHSQAGATSPLAFCGSALRAWAMLVREAGG